MIEKINRISNPLTIIAIFAAIAETAGTVSLGIVEQSLQSVFVWFVMLFPVLIVVAFFITLNCNPKVLYAPSDFQDEKNFIELISDANRMTSDASSDAKQMLSDLKLLVESKATDNHLNPSEAEIAKDKIVTLEEKIETVSTASSVMTSALGELRTNQAFGLGRARYVPITPPTDS